MTNPFDFIPILFMNICIDATSIIISMSDQQKKQPEQAIQPQPTPNNEQAREDSPREHSHRSQSSSSQSYSSHSSSPHDDKEQHEQGLPGVEAMNEGNEGEQDKNEVAADRKIRYKYCCKICKHTDKSKKACVCVVPKNQRRTEIGEQGCQTCGCIGCSKEDFISRGEDPEYKPGQKNKKQKKEKEKQGMEFEARNGCCRKCMKAFSKSNKSCLCQVPEDVRNTKLPSSGCKICGCFGCNPEDKKDPKHRKATKRQKQRQRSRDKKKKRAQSSSSSSHSLEYINPATLNFYNVDKSVIGGMMVNQFRVDPALLGFGIPQRTHSYIIGKPK